MKDISPLKSQIVRDWRYIGPTTNLQEMYFTYGAYQGNGHILGILTADASWPQPPGHLGNASTFSYPVHYYKVPGATMVRLRSGDPTLKEDVVRLVKQMEIDGVRAILSTSSYFGYYQKEAAAAVRIPVYLSPLQMIPWARVGLRSDQKVGVISFDIDKISSALLDACNITQQDRSNHCVFVDGKQMETLAQFADYVPFYHRSQLRAEILQLTCTLLDAHPEIGAIVLQETDFSPFAADIQSVAKCPVFDAYTLSCYVSNVTAHKPFYGFV